MKSSSKKIKINKRFIPIIVIILIVAVIASFFIAKTMIQKKKIQKINDYLSQRIETNGELNIISDAAVVDDKKNTIVSIKEAVRLGANTVTLDLCFDSNDVPVVCDDFNNISENSLKLEDVFKLLKEEKYSSVKLNLRLNQIGSIKKLNELLNKYEMTDRVILSGFDENRYNMLDCSSTSAGVFFDCVPEKDPQKASEYIFSLIDDYGISGVIINYADITPELVEKLNQHGKAFIVSGVDDELSMYEALSTGANIIETSSPDTLLEIYNNWRTQSKENVEKSIMDDLK